MEDFNLHLTGDVHAIGAAHNLAAAFLDNHLHHKNALGIDQHAILWPRVVDISDRAVRRAVIGLGGRENGVPRETEWVITVASEVMAVLALATDLQDLRARLGRIVLATTTARHAGHLRGPRRRRVDDRAAHRRDQAEPAADARGRPGVRPLRAVREHRPRQQLDHRGPPGARDERDRLHRGRLRGRHGRREVLRHQVPGVGAAAGRGGRRGDHPRVEDAWRRRPDRGRQAARPGAARGERRGGAGRWREPRQADRERPPVQRPGGRGDQLLPHRHRGGGRGDQGGLARGRRPRRGRRDALHGGRPRRDGPRRGRVGCRRGGRARRSSSSTRTARR